MWNDITHKTEESALQKYLVPTLSKGCNKMIAKDSTATTKGVYLNVSTGVITSAKKKTEEKNKVAY